MDDNRKIRYLEELIRDAEWRIGSYIASVGSEDPYVQGQIKKIETWTNRMNKLLEATVVKPTESNVEEILVDEKTMQWTIVSVESQSLPPMAVGYWKEVDGQKVFESVAYCFDDAQAEFILKSFVDQCTPISWEYWEKEQENR